MIWALLAILAAYALAVVALNRWNSPAQVVSLTIHRSQSSIAVPTRLRLVSWNLGYAGLGADANFIADGGTDLLPKSKQTVLNNVGGIQSTLESFAADIILLQEVARPSFINRQVDLFSAVRGSLSEYQYVYSPDVKTRLIPYPLRIDIGSAVFSRPPIQHAEGTLLPLETGYHAGLLRKHYRMLVCRFALSNSAAELIVINIHLAAFDKDGVTRLEQLQEVLEFAKAEFAKGNFVVLGGDWNLRLVPTDFPHRTAPEFLFWLADFPHDDLPPGWHLAADSNCPTVRTNHQAYEPGVNYVCVIDGFLLSPNIKCLRIRNSPLNFQYSDHHPAELEIELCEPIASA